MTDDPWLKTSIMAKRGLAKGEAKKRHELTIAGQGSFHYVYGPYAKPVLTIDPGDVVAVETEDAFGGVITSEQDSPTAKLQVSVPQSAMRPDRRERGREGRLPRRAYPGCGNTGRAASRQDLHHSGIRRPGRNRVDCPAQSAAAGAREGDARRQERRALERQDHAALRAVHRHDRDFARDRGDLLAAAGLSRRQHGSAGRGARRHPVFAGACQGRLALCRRLPCGARRWRTVGRCDRAARHRHAADRRHQGLELCLAAARDRKTS